MASGGVVPFEELRTADLVRGEIYAGGPQPHVGADPLHPLTGVGNTGGIRFLGSGADCRLMVLFSTQEDEVWPDDVDERASTVTYFGDNRSPMSSASEPKGNAMLRRLFSVGMTTEKGRARWPPVLLFTSVTRPGLPARSVRFRGLCVPGAPGVPEEDWLVAKWF